MILPCHNELQHQKLFAMYVCVSFANGAVVYKRGEGVQTGLCHLQRHTATHPCTDDVTNREAWLHELEVPEAVRTLAPKGFTWFASPYGGTLDRQVKEVRNRFSGVLVISGGNVSAPYRQERRIVYEGTDVIRGVIPFRTRVIRHLTVRTFPMLRGRLVRFSFIGKGIVKR